MRIITQSRTGEAMLEVKSLRKTFDATVAVDDVSLHTASGETVGLLGPNGDGKTTTVSMIAGISGDTRALSSEQCFQVSPSMHYVHDAHTGFANPIENHVVTHWELR
jgi:ABC-type branched-subunit amino acid transport system ATPase component